MKKFIIVGLGNIGNEYEETRHNVGFKIIDYISQYFGANFSLDKSSYNAKINYKGKIIILIKPTTYMNLSGSAVKYWVEKENIPLENVLIVTDDISLDFGVFRLRKKGSDGGHNGLKSINNNLNTNQYPRFRFGVGKDFPKGGQVNYVLGEWTRDQKNELDKEKIKIAKEIIISFIFEGIDITMNRYNN